MPRTANRGGYCVTYTPLQDMTSFRHEYIFIAALAALHPNKMHWLTDWAWKEAFSAVKARRHAFHYAPIQPAAVCTCAPLTPGTKVAIVFHVQGLIKKIHLPVQRVLLINAGL